MEGILGKTFKVVLDEIWRITTIGLIPFTGTLQQSTKEKKITGLED
jgi:hypothetical protein